MENHDFLNMGNLDHSKLLDQCQDRALLSAQNLLHLLVLIFGAPWLHHVA
jgi:hypothetical protein